MKKIYGLKQAGRPWHQMLSEKLQKLNYKQSSADMCLYNKIMKTAINLVPIAEIVLSAEDMNLLSTHETSLFRTMAGALLWIARCIRLDIAFAVHQMTRRTHAPRICDLKVVEKRLLCHLAGTSEYRLDISKMNEDTTIRFEIYSDADWASESTDRKPINGVSLSTMESEFISNA
jgi:hypothetical protein